MPDTLALFPLGTTVLFPGVVLPLHIFEERYRLLVRDLMELPDGAPVRFGVVAIRQGWEVGAGNAEALYSVGCTAVVRRINPHPDGRFDVVSVGQDRFTILAVDHVTKPYLTATVEWLTDDDGPGPESQVLARVVSDLFRIYATSVAALQGVSGELSELPTEPRVLSHLVASVALLSLDDRQELLAENSTRTRLRRETTMLRRESAMVAAFRAVPVPLSELAVMHSVN